MLRLTCSEKERSLFTARRYLPFSDVLLRSPPVHSRALPSVTSVLRNFESISGEEEEIASERFLDEGH